MEKHTFLDKYDLEPVSLTVRGKRLELHALKNWDGFIQELEKKGEAYIREFPYWIKIWEASLVLADHLIGLGIDKDRRILEIGAGMGVTGLFLGAFGYRVTITDFAEDSLELLRLNVEKNRLDTVRIEKLDWLNPAPPKKYDVICGSEVIYRETFVDPILNLFSAYLKPEGSAYLAHDFRHLTMKRFLEEASKGFRVEALGKTLRSEEEIYRIMVHTLTFPSHNPELGP